MFFRAEGVGRVERGEEVKKGISATQNYSYYPVYSKFFGLNEFNRANGLNGIAVTTRPNKTFNLFSSFLPFNLSPSPCGLHFCNPHLLA